MWAVQSGVLSPTVLAALLILGLSVVGWLCSFSALPPLPPYHAGQLPVSQSAGVVRPAAAQHAHTCDPLHPSFFALANLSATDKVTTHHYQHAYSAHLAPLRCTLAAFLEIGLGCNMKYGAGHSVPLWLEYLPRATVSILEYDRACAAHFAQANPLAVPADQWQRLRVFAGDQSLPDHLLLAAHATGPYDVIVDDGGHTMRQQLVSLATLLPHVKPGGLYIIEDLGTSTKPLYDREIRWTTAEYINAMSYCLHTMSWSSPQRYPGDPTPDPCSLAKHVESISCYEEVCVLKLWGEADKVFSNHHHGVRS